MPGPIESSGDIEIFGSVSGANARGGSVPYFDDISPGDRVALVFSPLDGSSPPYQLKIVSPSGSTIVDTIVRELPTGQPQSPPPIEFTVSMPGLYKLTIREMRGSQRGEATIRVAK